MSKPPDAKPKTRVKPGAEDAKAAEAEKPKSKKKLIIIIIAAVVLLGGGAAAFFLLKGGKEQGAEHAEAEKAVPKAPAVYIPLDPPFTVNFETVSNARFLQIAVQLMTRDPEMVEFVKANIPAIRNDLLLLFSQQTAAGLSNVEGKEKLRAAALEAVRSIVVNEGGHSEKIEGLYFTTLVMQ
jgi:flagellar FliL protein